MKFEQNIENIFTEVHSKFACDILKNKQDMQINVKGKLYQRLIININVSALTKEKTIVILNNFINIELIFLNI